MSNYPFNSFQKSVDSMPHVKNAKLQVLNNVRCLSLEEQLALVADIATVLREAVRSEDEVAEAAYLAESSTFQRLVEHGLRQVREGKVKKVEALLSEL